MKTKRILYLVPHRKGRSPGQRFRCEHFIPYLEGEGYKITYSNILSQWDDKYFYSFGNYGIKFFIVFKSFLKRLFDVCRAKNYDAVFIYREAFMMGTTIIERLISWQKVPIIFDFDDSIWLNDTSAGNMSVRWLKKPQKTADICSLSHTVIVGNQYLSEYASQFNSNIVIVPTTIDTTYHKVSKEPLKFNSRTLTIGWTGTETTIKHLATLSDVLKTLKSQYGEKINFMVIADVAPQIKGVDIEFIKWSQSSEIDQLLTFDIGIMPLPDDQWTRGKCGFKGLQYMALGIPAVMSSVGVNTEIIQHGVNGMLANSDEEWIDSLSQLVENESLRNQLGAQGRITVEGRYSVTANVSLYRSIFQDL